MNIKKKMAIASLAAIPVLGIGGGFAYASTTTPILTPAVHHAAAGADGAEAKSTEAKSTEAKSTEAKSTEAKSAEVDAPGGANVQQGANLQQGGNL